MMRTHGQDMRPLYQPLHDMYEEGRSYKYMSKKLKITPGQVAGTLYRMRHGLLREWTKITPTRGRETRRWSQHSDRDATRPQPSLPKLKFMENA